MPYQMYYNFQTVFRYCNNTHDRKDKTGVEIKAGIPGKNTISLKQNKIEPH